METPAIVGLAHVNLNVPVGTLNLANEFYGNVMGMQPIPVPELQRDTLAWFQMPTGQQIHISFAGPSIIASQAEASRHPCFRIASLDALRGLQQRLNDHQSSGSKAAVMEVDKVGERDSGAQGKEYPTRFFARDYAGNRLEFSL